MTNCGDGRAEGAPAILGVVQLPENLNRDLWDLMKDKPLAMLGPIGCSTTGANEKGISNLPNISFQGTDSRPQMTGDQFTVIGPTDIPKDGNQLMSALLIGKTVLDESKEEQSMSKVRRFLGEQPSNLSSFQEREKLHSALHQHDSKGLQNVFRDKALLDLGHIDKY